eukprot:gene33352-41156_t
MWLDTLSRFYLSEYSGNKIRSVTSGSIALVTSGVSPYQLFEDSNGNLYVANGGSRVISIVVASSGLSTPHQLYKDSNGNLFVANPGGDTVLIVAGPNSGGIFAGITNQITPVGDGGAARSATFYGPGGIYVTRDGSMYIAEVSGNKIRKISSSNIVSTIAGTGSLT